MPDISLLPKEYAVPAAPAPKGSRALILFSALVFFGALSGWGGLYFYKTQLQKETNENKAKVEEIKNTSLKDKQDEIEKIKEASEKLNNLKGVLDGHIYASNVFAAIENLTLKTVYFNELDLDSKKAALELKGVADSYDTFAKQFSHLKNQTETIKKIDVESVSLSKEGVEFSFIMDLNKALLLKQKEKTNNE